jgi:hypothetical protein
VSRNNNGFYQGCDVSDKFMSRWRSMEHVGSARPYAEVWVRRGRLERSWHNNWPNPQFGRVFGKAIGHQWYPDWTPLDDWTQLFGVYEIDLDQSFDNNGIVSASITVDNVQWVEKVGIGGAYHQRDRGYLWPWHGYVPPRRPGAIGQVKNSWYMRLPNAQILVKQGYGSDTAIKTFTGLIDTLDGSIRPDRLVIASRDFGGVLTDSYLFGWNKTKHVVDPVTFVPKDYAKKYAYVARAASKTNHRWIIVNDATDIVRIALRWAGFKEWQIENAGVELSVPVTYDKSHTLMDMITDMATALGFQFFMTEPTEGNDLSMGVPVFRRPSVIRNERSLPITLTEKQLLTDVKPKHDNKDDRYIIRVRGVINRKTGRKLGGDSAKRVTFTYWPPWIKNMAGVIKQLTYYNIGSQGVLGLQTTQQCRVAVMLIAIQIALGRDTASAQCPGQPGFGLDSFGFISDSGSGIHSRLYVTNRKSVMTLGGDGTSQQQSPYSGSSATSQNNLLWSTELGGSLCDNPEFDHIVKDYNRAIHGAKVISTSPKGFD